MGFIGSALGSVGNTLGGAVGGLTSGIYNGLGLDNQYQTGNTLQNPEVAQSVQASQGDIAQQQAFVNALNAQNGIQNQSSVYNQLQSVASGQGPNPAQAMLAQATGANVANQAALMAGQRGAGANAGLIARQAAQQGGALQQNAAGQGATLQAQQSLGALNQLGGIAGQQVGQQQQGLNALNANQQNLLAAQTGAINQQNQVNAGLSQANQQAKGKLVGGLLGGAGQAVSSAAAAAHGGEISSVAKAQGVPMYSQGGMPRSHYGRHLAGMNMKSGGHVPGQAKVQGDSLKNDTVPAILSPGEIVIPRSILQGKNPGASAAKFVMDTLKKQGKKK